MAVYDRWHKSHPKLDNPDPNKNDKPCKCGRGKNKLYPTAVHGRGKRWQVRWRDDAGGQPKRNFAERYGDDPARHAEACDAKVNADMDSGAYVDPAAGKVTLERYAKKWRSGLTVKASSLEIIDKRLAHIYDVEAGPRTRRPPGTSSIAGSTMADLARNPHAVQQWIKSLERKGLSPRYVGHIAGTLSSIFIAAMDNGVVGRNPMKAASIKLPTIPKKKIVPWTREQLDAGRGALREQDSLVVDLGVGAGLRQGEIFGVAVEDFTFLGKGRKIHVRRQVRLVEGEPVFTLPKYEKEREVPLSDALSRRVAAHIQAHPPVEVTLPWERPDSSKTVTVKLLIVWKDAVPWNGRSFASWWRKARKAAGVPIYGDGHGMHVLRHTAASAWLAAGVDIRKLAAWLGHEDLGFTLKTYTHFMPDVEDRGRAAMDEFLDGPADEGKIGGKSAPDVPPAQGG